MKSRPLRTAELQARRQAFDEIKAHRPLTPDEQREADRLDHRFYMRCWHARQAEAERSMRRPRKSC